MTSRLQALVSQTQAHRVALDSAAQVLVPQIEQAWLRASQDAINHLEIVFLNNPEADPAELLTRYDVVQAMTEPFSNAARSTMTVIEEAWRRGQELGIEHAREQMELLGLDVPDQIGGLPQFGQVYLRLVGDVQANALAARVRLEQVYGDTELTAVQRRARAQAWRNELSRRNRYTATVALREAHTEAQDAVYASGNVDPVSGVTLGVRKVWVTRFGPGTCRACAALHGTVVELGAEFDGSAFLTVANDVTSASPPKVYETLLGPPRHPNCRCLLVPWLPEIDGEDGGPTLADLAKFALEWVRKIVAALRAKRTDT